MKYFKFDKNVYGFAFFLAALIFSLFVFSCQSTRTYEAEISRKLLGNGVMTEDALADYFMSVKPGADRKKIKNFASLYIKEARAEGINSDVAFAQMCLLEIWLCRKCTITAALAQWMPLIPANIFQMNRLE